MANAELPNVSGEPAYPILLVLAIPVGLAAALVTIGFRAVISKLHWLLTHRGEGMIDTAMHLPWWQRVLVPTIGGCIAGGILVAAYRWSSSKSSDYLEAVSVGDGTLGTRATLLRSASSLFSIASGGSIGREGSMVQLSAYLASLVGRMCISIEQRQILVGCGAAAGIAAVYNAPLAGVIFVSEIVMRSMALERLAPLMVSAVVASATMRIFHEQTLFGTPTFELVSNYELLPYAVLGAIAGIAGPGFLGAIAVVRRAFDRFSMILPVKLAIGGLIVGLISVRVPHVWGNGYGVVLSLLGDTWTWDSIALLLVCKVVATAATAGSGAVGGVFTPTLFVGAALGTLWGLPWHHLYPNTIGSANAYALVGMGAFLAATTHAPFMAVLMVFEMTLDHRILLPLMLACILGAYISRAIGAKSVYAISERPKL